MTDLGDFVELELTGRKLLFLVGLFQVGDLDLQGLFEGGEANYDDYTWKDERFGFSFMVKYNAANTSLPDNIRGPKSDGCKTSFVRTEDDRWVSFSKNCDMWQNEDFQETLDHR